MHYLGSDKKIDGNEEVKGARLQWPTTKGYHIILSKAQGPSWKRGKKDCKNLKSGGWQ